MGVHKNTVFFAFNVKEALALSLVRFNVTNAQHIFSAHKDTFCSNFELHPGIFRNEIKISWLLRN